MPAALTLDGFMDILAQTSTVAVDHPSQDVDEESKIDISTKQKHLIRHVGDVLKRPEERRLPSVGWSVAPVFSRAPASSSKSSSAALSGPTPAAGSGRVRFRPSRGSAAGRRIRRKQRPGPRHRCRPRTSSPAPPPPDPAATCARAVPRRRRWSVPARRRRADARAGGRRR